MRLDTLLLCLLLGLASNLIAELFLALDLKTPFSQLTTARKRLRVLRWIAGLCGLVIVGLFDPPPARLAVLALFSVSAATDLETQYLPPDWFVYGAVAAGIAGGFAVNGLAGLRDAAVAQAVCFVVMTAGVLFAGIADSGDIKLLMQYGAACGSLAGVSLGFVAEFGLRLAVLAYAVVSRLLGGAPAAQALRHAATLKVPHGPIAWAGLLIVTVSAGLR
jgi:hypothetical protein